VLSKMEVKTSLLDNMIGVGDMVLLEPLSEDTFIENLKKRFDHNEIYVSNESMYICSVVFWFNIQSRKVLDMNGYQEELRILYFS